MGQKIVVGPMNKGLRNDVTPFNVDNESFPSLINAYQWRGRIKRKRGTSPLGRLSRYIGTTDGAGNLSTTIIPFPLQHGISQFFVGSNIFTDGDITATASVTLLTTGPGTGTLNRTTGLLTITGSNANTAVNYFPGLPVLGLEPFVSDPTSIPQQVAFDTTYSYNVPLMAPGLFYDVSFYNNPATGTYAGYVQKTTWTPLNWNLQNYQQIWTTNYSGAMWATPGIPAPFSATNIGMQFKPIVSVTVLSATTANLNILLHGLVVGDFVFVNEVATTTGINYETGYVTTVTDANNVIVTFPSATLATNGTGGIAQYLTSTANTSKDCIRWYNGSMVDFPSTQVPSITGMGWVNFSPPLTSGTPGNFSIADLPPTSTPYYLVGAKMVVPFKDRLLFFGPVIQTSSQAAVGAANYLPDTVIYSQNGTPYYTASFPYSTNQPSLSVLAAVTYQPILVPTNQTATATSWWENATGYGGFISSGYSRPITTVSINEDALIVGFTDRQTRLLYTGNDIVPFNFYVINSELGSDSTFSSITLDRGVITIGGRGIVLTSQISSQRIDVEIPDEVFEITGTTQAARSICAQRDFINEWIQFTYPSNTVQWTFPNQTLQYNYREATWSVFRESYTTYGTIRLTTGLTWAGVGSFYTTWSSWNVPWDSGTDTIGQPLIYAGNAQGFVVIKGTGTEEATSLYIQNVSGSTITSPNHCLNNGDYIQISGVQGTIASSVNGKIFSVELILNMDGTYNANQFVLNPTIPSGTYTGGGQITRMYVPFIQTKQFPISWEMARKTRLGSQQYLFSSTTNSQLTLLIFLSQNSINAYNNLEFPNPVKLVPSTDSENNSLIYSTTLYTCPESTNLGLTPSNTNLQMLTASQQQQIWHRVNTSLLGDVVQLGFTMNDAQMRAKITVETDNITGATQSNPCVLTCSSTFEVGDLVLISSVVGMTQLNNNNYVVTNVTPTTVTIKVDARRFSPYISGGTASFVPQGNQFAEIELHSIILDLQPSQLLA